MSDRPSSTYHASSGEAYERFLGRWTKRLAVPFVAFANLPASGDLLDIGCGTGSVAVALAGRFPGRRIVGVDIAEPYVGYARSQASIDGVSFELGDATRLRWEDGYFAGGDGTTRPQLHSGPRRCGPRDAPRDAARRRAGGRRLGLPRRPRLSAPVLGYRRRPRSGSGRNARPTVLQPAGAAGRSGRALAVCRSRSRSSAARSRSAWTMSTSPTTGSRCSAAKVQSEPTSTG